MVKSIISAALGFLLLVFGSILENNAIQTTFSDFNEKVIVLQSKIEDEVAVKQDALEVQKFWIKQKETLHVLIPHNEIKEIDLWISETLGLVENKMYDDAFSKVEVVLELIEQIPKTFALRIENIL